MGKDAEAKTILYLIRHAATEANLARPARLQGRRHNPPLDPLGVRQSEATRDFLASQSIQHCYCSPMARAMQTAAIVSEPHHVTPCPLDELTECDIGRWEGMDRQTIRYLDAEAYHQFMANPAEFGYPGGESFADVYRRVAPTLDELLRRHRGEGILVVGHHVVNRVYLASLLGLTPDQARQVTLDNCGISVVICEGDTVSVGTLNAAFHLPPQRAA